MRQENNNKPYILVSACLLGSKTRYDGKSKPYKSSSALIEYFNVIPVCPETDSGLPIPRDPSEIKGDKVFSKSGKDVTSFYNKGAELTLNTAKKYNVKFAILKENSPSCGSNFIHDGSFTANLVKGEGYTTKLLRKNGIEVFNEDMIPTILLNEYKKHQSEDDK